LRGHMRLWLLTCVTAVLPFLGLTAAPSTAKLAYQRLGDRNKTEGIYVARADASDAHRIAGGYSPYISPTGHKVAYFGKGGRGLHVVGVGGRHDRLVMPDAFDPGSAAMLGWHRDDRSIVAAKVTQGESAAFLAEIREMTLRRVGRGTAFGGASFAPTGSRFAIGDASDGGSGVVVFHTDPLRRRTISSGGSPVWGRRGLAYEHLDKADNELVIVVRDNHGHKRTVLRETTGSAFPIDWSCDGRVLLVSERRIAAGGRFVYRAILVTPASGEVKRLAPELGEIWGISGDARHVLAEKGRDVVTVNRAGKVKTLVREATHPTWTK
jgi:hypothetical protein